ncbi:hypothetical protein A8F94_15280 [Bacillus sp. FJAT-27225]|uniref:hypothetical protein n=1 Tax=Bacillus sp. FJAT-27225 TaxID=1743144 RepID=UPI00080C294B|nr:hypothetical protein [Bacillus sp. FJAT-27225]OCA84087.1 hypothetical protein A8F94_15280 [Bacillus sp. FJAT-27225]
MKSLKKQIVAGVLSGCILFPAISAGAMTLYVDGTLYTRNPLTSGPQGYAWTMGYKTITAKVTVSKSGETTKSLSASKNAGTSGSSVETDWLTGPTYSSAGTTFKSTHTGYSYYGVYETLTASKSF